VGRRVVALSFAAFVACDSLQPVKEDEGTASSVEMRQFVTRVYHRLATADGGGALLAASDDCCDGMSHNDFDFRIQRVGVAVEELRSFAQEQVLDITTMGEGVSTPTLARPVASSTSATTPCRRSTKSRWRGSP
jgi:hypothetical protein